MNSSKRRDFLGSVAAIAVMAASINPVFAQSAVSRDDTLVIEALPTGPGFKNYNNMNPYAVGNDLRNHYVYLSEPLFWWSHVNDALIPIQATGFTFNSDFTSVDVTIRNGVFWSDGKPFTADDVVYSFELLRADGAGKKSLLLSTEIASSVASIEKVGSNVVRFKLKEPDPRFVLRELAVSFTSGFYVVPKHVYEKVSDPATFTNYAADGSLPLGTGPYKVVSATPERIMMDRRNDWWGLKKAAWGAQAGKFYTDAPAPLRLITVPMMATEARAQAMGAGQLDTMGNSPPAIIKSLLEQSKGRLSTWTGNEAPYGYTDFWPSAIWFNHALEKWSDVRVRRAMSYAIDRDQIIKLYHGGGVDKLYAPLPNFEPMLPYINDAKALAEAKGINTVDIAKAAALMTEAGYVKNDKGFWARNGVEIKANIIGSSVMDGLGPIVAEQFRRAGFNITFGNRPDYRAAMFGGNYDLALWGFNGGTFDPFASIDMYHSRGFKPVGESTARFFRWHNPEMDKIAEQLGKMRVNAPEMRPLVKRASEIWMDQVISIPISQWYIRVVHSNERWIGWPSVKAPYAPLEMNHWTSPLVIHGLKKAK